jgi:hypothetical protein
MRLMEVGTKAQGMSKMQEAEEFFWKAYDLYSLFWWLQMNVINTETLSEISEEISTEEEETKRQNEWQITQEKPTETREELSKKIDVNTTKTTTPRKGFMGKLWELVKKAVDCCIE